MFHELDENEDFLYHNNWSKIKHGVPQGSVLGPLLFLLYINDFPLAINKSSMPILFADDTSLVVADRNPDNIHAKLNINLQLVQRWFKSNLLTINFLKTHCMHFKTKNTVSTETILACNNNVITEVSQIKFLGLTIDDTLSWNLHIDNVMKRLTSVCYMIRAVKPYMSFSSLIMIYYSLFHSVLAYGILFWGISSSSVKLFKLQKRVVRRKVREIGLHVGIFLKSWKSCH
jgi:hypothetical protein